MNELLRQNHLPLLNPLHAEPGRGRDQPVNWLRTPHNGYPIHPSNDDYHRQISSSSSSSQMPQYSPRGAADAYSSSNDPCLSRDQRSGYSWQSSKVSSEVTVWGWKASSWRLISGQSMSLYFVSIVHLQVRASTGYCFFTTTTLMTKHIILPVGCPVSLPSTNYSFIKRYDAPLCNQYEILNLELLYFCSCLQSLVYVFVGFFLARLLMVLFQTFIRDTGRVDGSE